MGISNPQLTVNHTIRSETRVYDLSLLKLAFPEDLNTLNDSRIEINNLRSKDQNCSITLSSFKCEKRLKNLTQLEVLIILSKSKLF